MQTTTLTTTMEHGEDVGNATENMMRLGTYADLSTRVMKRKVGHGFFWSSFVVFNMRGSNVSKHTISLVGRWGWGGDGLVTWPWFT